jgi:hypothetical protein
MSPNSCAWSFGQAVAGDADGDNYRRPGVVIEAVLAKALTAPHRVPIRNLKKTVALLPPGNGRRCLPG